MTNDEKNAAIEAGYSLGIDDIDESKISRSIAYNYLRGTHDINGNPIQKNIVRSPVVAAKPKICQCYFCANKFPETQLATTTIEVATGRSSGSPTIGGSLFNFGGKTGNAVRVSYNFGRTFYKNKTVYICNDCQKKRSTDENNEVINVVKWVIVIGVLAAIAFLI